MIRMEKKGESKISSFYYYYVFISKTNLGFFFHKIFFINRERERKKNLKKLENFCTHFFLHEYFLNNHV